MLLGAHMSISGGVSKALIGGSKLGCQTIQMFTKNNTQWRAAKLDEAEAQEFRKLHQATGINPIIAHTSYLINLASPNTVQLQRSRAALLEELQRAERLGVAFLVVHPGAYLDSSIDEGLKVVADSINLLHRQTRGFNVKICLESTAGQGTNLAFRFEHLAKIIEDVNESDRLGICLDTCHLFASGYDIRTPEGYHDTIERVESLFGTTKIKVIHLNDSKKGLNCRVDRHEHIGKGQIGLDAFRFLLNDRRFADVPMIIETPKHPDTLAADKINLATLRSLINSTVG